MSSDYRSLGGIDEMFEQEDDIINQWIQETGIELVHQTPTKQEMEDIWTRWQKMPNKNKKLSDQKSIELFGMTNEQHHVVLELLYI